jgi:hypothetical protein
MHDVLEYPRILEIVAEMKESDLVEEVDQLASNTDDG